jgi:hypothetical protein
MTGNTKSNRNKIKKIFTLAIINVCQQWPAASFLLSWAYRAKMMETTKKEYIGWPAGKRVAAANRIINYNASDMN